MENSHSKLKRQCNKLKVDTRTIKFRSVTPDLQVAKAVLQIAPKEVITAISNAMLNARQGPVEIPPHLIFFLRIIITTLTGFVTVNSQFPPSDT